MALLSGVIEAKLAGRQIGAAQLAELHFRSMLLRVWTGVGDLVTAGYTWKGVGSLVSVSDISPPVSFSAAPLTFTLSGHMPELLEIVALASAGFDDAEGRTAKLWVQFFDVDDGAFTLLDSPVCGFVGTMRSMGFAVSADQFSASLYCESVFIGRRQAPNGLLTHADQQRRFAGDNGLIFVSTVASKRPLWPTF